MEEERLINKQEKSPSVTVVAPAVESLLDTNTKESFWQREIKENKQLEKQVETRKNIIKRIGEDHYDAEFYKSLTFFLQSDSYNDRLILYLPFELIPQKNHSPEANEFLAIYMDKWRGLLNVSDVRENFVEGDVLESELRDEPLERVVKAAHLIPKLMEKGILSIPEVTTLIENNPDTTLQNSVIDVLPVLVDMGLLPQNELEQIVEKYRLDLNYRKIRTVPEEKVTGSRAKWLEDKDKQVTMPKNAAELIDKPFYEREKNIENDIEEIKKAVESIQSNPELSKFIYPACILFGSKIKGYGAVDADMDVAVFVKPNTPTEEWQKLKEILSQAFPRKKIGGKVVKFWLEEKDSELVISGEEISWAHVLFEGSWIGNEDTIKELYQKLLPGFLYSKDKTIFGGDARTIWLEEMEKDTLQYRLMHKGYARLFPKQGGIQTKHSDRIDGGSMFYDSGFRRLASKLYLSRVFLPQLQKTK